MRLASSVLIHRQFLEKELPRVIWSQMVVIVEKKWAIISQWMSLWVSMAQLCSAGLSGAQWDSLRLSGVLWGSPGLIGGGGSVEVSGAHWGSLGSSMRVNECQWCSAGEQWGLARLSEDHWGWVGVREAHWGQWGSVGLVRNVYRPLSWPSQVFQHGLDLGLRR